MMQLIPSFISSEDPMVEFGGFFKDFVDDEKDNMDVQSQRISFAWHLNPEVLPQYSDKYQDI